MDVSKPNNWPRVEELFKVKGWSDADIYNRCLHLDSESNIRYVNHAKPIPKSCLCS